jgi:hypothetical protein
VKRITLTRGLAVSSALSLAGLIATFASCATNNQDPVAAPGPTTLPEAASTDAPPAAEPDAGSPDGGGCDAGDPSCNPRVVSCDEVAWCMPNTSGPIVHPLMAVWGSGKSDVWAVGSGGTILHYDGSVWKVTPSGLKNTFYGVWGSGPSDVWIVSSTEIILHGSGFQNGTATWTTLATQVFAERKVNAVWGSSPNDVRVAGSPFGLELPPPIYVGQGDQFVQSADGDGGTTWRPLVGSSAVTSIWGSSASDVWMTGDNSLTTSYERGKTMHGTPSEAGADAGGTDDSLDWTSVDSQSNVTLQSVWGSSAADVWAVGAVGTIRHITPVDIRWQKVSSPTIETLNGVWGSGPNDIWAVGNSGTILHGDGTSFQLSTAQFPIGYKPDLYGIWGSGPDDVWIVGDRVLLHYTGPKSVAPGGHP